MPVHAASCYCICISSRFCVLLLLLFLYSFVRVLMTVATLIARRSLLISRHSAISTDSIIEVLLPCCIRPKSIRNVLQYEVLRYAMYVVPTLRKSKLRCVIIQDDVGALRRSGCWNSASQFGAVVFLLLITYARTHARIVTQPDCCLLYGSRRQDIVWGFSPFVFTSWAALFLRVRKTALSKSVSKVVRVPVSTNRVPVKTSHSSPYVVQVPVSTSEDQSFFSPWDSQVPGTPLF